MASHKNSLGRMYHTHFTWETDFAAAKLRISFLKDIDFLHVCHETNTFVLSSGGGYRLHKDEAAQEPSELWYNILDLNDSSVPYGQVAFLSYWGDGCFLLEGATDRFQPGLIESAFRSFGYTDPKMIDESPITGIQTCKKDTFHLKLKYGV